MQANPKCHLCYGVTNRKTSSKSSSTNVVNKFSKNIEALSSIVLQSTLDSLYESLQVDNHINNLRHHEQHNSAPVDQLM